MSYDLVFFFFNDTATTEIYTLSLHDALPIFGDAGVHLDVVRRRRPVGEQVVEVSVAVGGEAQVAGAHEHPVAGLRSEEHTSELQSRQYLVCRLLLEKKKKSTSQQSKTTNRDI